MPGTAVKRTETGSKPERNGSGRPTKLTKETQAAICRAIAAGATYKDACLLADVSTYTMILWRRRAETGEKRYVEFVEALEKALATYKTACLQRIQDMAKGNPEKGIRGSWQAYAWILERRFPSDFARRYDIDVRGDASAVTVNVGAAEADYDHSIEVRKGDVRAILSKFGLAEILADTGDAG